MSNSRCNSSVFQIIAPVTDPRKLTQSVLQITAMLDMYQAELARVLKVHCGDIGELASGKRCLEPDTEPWQQAQLFVRFYQALYRSKDGDGVGMRHWLRIENKDLNGVPHLIVVDDGELARVVEYLE